MVKFIQFSSFEILHRSFLSTFSFFPSSCFLKLGPVLAGMYLSFYFLPGLRLSICIAGEGPQNSTGRIQEHRHLGLTVGKKGKKVLENGNFCSELATYVHTFFSFWTLQILEGNLVRRCQCFMIQGGHFQFTIRCYRYRLTFAFSLSYTGIELTF